MRIGSLTDPLLSQVALMTTREDELRSSEDTYDPQEPEKRNNAQSGSHHLLAA